MSKTIALVGNPNCGKSTIFNILTGSNQYVGNWPGVTVEKKLGKIKQNKFELIVVDLPGIYSLSTSTLEEVITREYIESDEVDLIVNIVDASNLERNLFLTLQLMEIGKPMIVALNMMDVLRAHKDELNIAHLSEHLGIEMVEVVAAKSQGIEALILAMNLDHPPAKLLSFYRPKIQRLINKVKSLLHIEVSPTLHAIRFIEEGMSAALGHQKEPVDLIALNLLVEDALKDEKLDRDMIISDEKYRFITELSSHVLKRSDSEKMTLTHRIDALVTNRWLAFPIFFGVMWIVFMLAFGPFGAFLKTGFEYLIHGLIIQNIANLLTLIGVSPWVYGLVVDGILGGVGSVLSFLPEITILFIVLSILEDTGYMARAAFIMDRILRRFGLSGKSFIPMIIGFGCTVPALMATRSLENEKDRRLTMMIIPFMSCSARFPIYAVFAAALFTSNQALAVYSMYIIGIVVALLSGIILKRFVTQGSLSGFIMELPEYHRPTLRNLYLHTWDKVKGFVVKAGTVLLLASIVIYVMSTYSFTLQPAAQIDSMIGSIGAFIAPLFSPLGFGDWRSSIALMVGFAAKEAVVSTLGVLYGVGGNAAHNAASLVDPIRAAYTPLSGFAFMTFSLLYLPCIAAFATLKREMNSWKWTLIAVGYQTGIAYLLALLIYQGGKLMGF